MGRNYQWGGGNYLGENFPWGGIIRRGEFSLGGIFLVNWGNIPGENQFGGELSGNLLKDQVRVFRAMLFGYFPMKREDFTRVYNPNRGLRVSSIKR